MRKCRTKRNVLKMRCLLLVSLIIVFVFSGCSERGDSKKNGYSNPVNNNASSSTGNINDKNELEVEKELPLIDYNEVTYGVKTLVDSSLDEDSEPSVYEILLYNCNDDVRYRCWADGINYANHYDENGHLEKRFYYDAGRTPDKKIFYEQGHWIEQYDYGYDGGIYRSEYMIYDSEGHSVCYEKYDDSSDYIKYLYTYENDLLIRKEEYVNNCLDAYEIYKYNVDSTVSEVERTYYFYGEWKIEKTYYEYDGMGNRIKEESYINEKTQSSHKEWEYYPNGEVKAYIQYRAGTPKVAAIWNYDDKGNIIETISYSYSDSSSHVGEYIVTHTYDDENREIESIEKHDGSISLSERKQYCKLTDEELREVMEEIQYVESYKEDESNNILDIEKISDRIELEWTPATTVGKIKYELIYYSGRMELAEYDKYGNVVKRSNYNSEGEYAYGSTIQYEYDSKGTKIAETFFSEDGRKEIEYRYDEYGNEIEVIPSEGHEYSHGKTVNEYDEHGNLIRQTRFIDGFELSSTEYKYDADNNVIWEIHYLDEGEEIQRWSISRTYNNVGELVEICYYDESDNVTEKETWDLELNTKSVYFASTDGNTLYLNSFIQYDDAGRELFTAQYDESGAAYYNKKYSYESVFDELGNEIQVDKYSAGELVTRTTRVFY